MNDKVLFIISCIIVICISIIGWKAERWFNWKVSYGGKVEQRIEQLEQRIEVLETAVGEVK